jgi:RNA polymerase sigma-70 factor (ECF subfamily)
MANVAKGDLELLKVLFERHHIHVYNFLYKMCGDTMLSEDLTQEVFYKLIKYRTSYKGGNFISWMFTIARNGLKTHFRKNKEQHDDISNVAYRLTLVEEENPSDYSDLQKALSALPSSDRELIILHRFHGAKYQEIAEIVGSTPGAIKTKMSRAIQKLKTVYLKTV